MVSNDTRMRNGDKAQGSNNFLINSCKEPTAWSSSALRGDTSEIRPPFRDQDSKRRALCLQVGSVRVSLSYNKFDAYGRREKGIAVKWRRESFDVRTVRSSLKILNWSESMRQEVVKLVPHTDMQEVVSCGPAYCTSPRLSSSIWTALRRLEDPMDNFECGVIHGPSVRTIPLFYEGNKVSQIYVKDLCHKFNQISRKVAST